LSELQELVEAVCGVLLHKQNFRRTVEASGLVAATGAMRADTGGRPARLYSRTAVARTAAAPGLSLPLARR
ncbi:MAG: NAD regulator, partial [Hyphomonadaceae bacterium]|nr:NAD regulator [Hyphomonadaceae bacterium]